MSIMIQFVIRFTTDWLQEKVIVCVTVVTSPPGAESSLIRYSVID